MTTKTEWQVDSVANNDRIVAILMQAIREAKNKKQYNYVLYRLRKSIHVPRQELQEKIFREQAEYYTKDPKVKGIYFLPVGSSKLSYDKSMIFEIWTY